MEKTIIDKNLFLKFANLLESNDIFFWIDFGTLLGAYRDKDFIEGDDDIDISLKAADYWKVKKIIELSQWKFKSIWRRELTVYHPANPQFHIDLFFYDKNGSEYSTYAYLQNIKTGQISVESRIVVPSPLLDEFISTEFCNHIFNIPKLTEDYLSCHYGNWLEKDSKWYYSKRINIDRTHALIAVIIPTFLRPEKIEMCLESLKSHGLFANKFQPFIKIYVGEQNLPEKQNTVLYKTFQEMGHKVVQLPHNCGLSYARNFLIQSSIEPYILIADDDYLFTSETPFEPMINLLQTTENIGIVGGALNDRQIYPSRIYINHFKNTEYNQIAHITKTLSYKNSQETCLQPSYKYFYTEFIPNFFMAKREIFNDIKWDNELKLAEHSDFFLRLKTTKWKVLFTPDTMVTHRPENSPQEYSNFRNLNGGKNCTESLKHLAKKYNLGGIQKFIFPVEIKNTYLEPETVNVVQLARIPCANSGMELNNLINKYSSKFKSRYILGAEYRGKHSNIPYRKFPIDLFWETNRELCIKIIKDADIVHVHHDIINDEELINILKTKPVIWTLYNLSQSLQYKQSDFNIKYLQKCKDCSHIITVADQSLQRKMFSDITDIKVPLVKMLFDSVKEKSNPIPIIAFAPTNRESTGIATKKYKEVLTIIEELKQEYIPFIFDLIEGLPYEENLARKQVADIIIDDVDPDYEKFHNTSIEAACFGAVSLTNYSGDDYPFLKTNIYTLKETLKNLLLNPHILKQEKEKIVHWKNKHYTPQKMIEIYENLYNNLIEKTNIRVTPKSSERKNTIDSEIEKNIINLIKYLNENCIEFCITGKTLLEIVNSKSILSTPITLFVREYSIKERILKTFPYLENILNIHIDTKSKIKMGTLYNISIGIPRPLLPYLKKHFGADWKK